MIRMIKRVHPALHECLFAVRIEAAGSVFDSSPGAFHLLEHLIASGAEPRVIDAGGRFDAHTYREYQAFVCAVPCTAVKSVLGGLLEEIHRVRKGIWSNSEQERAVAIMTRERLMHLRNPHEKLMEALDEAILCESYARPTSLVCLSRPFVKKDLHSLARRAYHSDRLRLVCVGPDARTVQGAIRAFGGSRAAPGYPRFPSCRRSPAVIKMSSPCSDEAFIRAEVPGLALSSGNDRFINRIASSLLAGPFSQLEEALGEKNSALCYDMFSDVSEFHSFAQIAFGAACKHADVKKMHAIVLEYLDRFHRSDPGAERWQRLHADTEQYATMLREDPYELFDFLMLESHAGMTREPDPSDLLFPWSINSKRVQKQLMSLFNPRTVALAIAA